MNKYKKALKIATEAHKGQMRTSGGEYITHPIRVASHFDEEKLKIIAILHDVVEDTKVTPMDLIIHFNEEIIMAIIALSRHKSETYYDFIIRCKRNPLARIVKIVDIKDNLSDLEQCHKKDKYNLAKHLLEKN